MIRRAYPIAPAQKNIKHYVSLLRSLGLAFY
jgi:hypothetical protein